MNSPDEQAGQAFAELVEVMNRLRSPGGCPWDAGQTHQSLVGYLVEETYEVVDAIEVGSKADLIEELGDLLLQVVFHSRIGEEESPAWNVADVCRGITDKLTRRHPHVFAGQEIDAGELEQVWHEQKVNEKQRTSVADGIPQSLPALSYSMKLARRCRDSGQQMPVDLELVAKLADLLGDGNAADFGAALAGLAYLTTTNGHDPEELLRAHNRSMVEATQNGGVA